MSLTRPLSRPSSKIPESLLLCSWLLWGGPELENILLKQVQFRISNTQKVQKWLGPGIICGSQNVRQESSFCTADSADINWLHPKDLQYPLKNNSILQPLFQQLSAFFQPLMKILKVWRSGLHNKLPLGYLGAIGWKISLET